MYLYFLSLLSGQLLVFVLISKGLSITRDVIPANEWRSIILIVSSFYMTNSIFLVLKTTVFTPTSYYIAVGILYVCMYAYITADVILELKKIVLYTTYFTPGMSPIFTTPLYYKKYMYIAFLILVLFSFTFEVICHYLAGSQPHLSVVMGVYEGSNVVILGIIGVVFRPQEYSPFFFMVPAAELVDAPVSK